MKLTYRFLCAVNILYLTYLISIFFTKTPKETSLPVLTENVRPTTQVREIATGLDFTSIKKSKYYMNVPHRILPKHFCRQRSILLVMVHSQPANKLARASIRRSWGSSENRQKNNVSMFFLLGYTPNSHLQEYVAGESAQFGDIIQVNFTDCFRNATLKSLMMLKLANLHCKDSVQYLLKVEDDVLVNLRNIVEMLGRDHYAQLLIGRLLFRKTPVRDPGSVWYVPDNFYPGKVYPNYLESFAYLMSMEVARKLYEVALEQVMFHIEDVFITGILAKEAKISPQHSALFLGGGNKHLMSKCIKHYFVFTGMSASQMISQDFFLSRC
ncbi:Galactosyl T domain containing protein [Asbolus verrucosus]|uniref:Hexosyltransferase n=1 Tax=Asbolus verrucosus TaxID=1661398 RepID=A0A482VCU7_ASBVE|nr:Galactosyl T domain containing protein [Asbolus verrucosus]